MMKIKTGAKFSGSMDMAFLGAALLKSPKFANEFYGNSLFADEMPFTYGLLSQFGFDADEQRTDSGTYVIKSAGVDNRPVYILGVTGDTSVGGVCHVTVNDGWAKNGATWFMGDHTTIIRFDNNGLSTGNGTTYRATVTGMTNGTPTPNDLFANGSPLNFISGTYGEASKTGHPIHWSTGDVYVNAMTTVRTKMQWTGDLLSDGGMEVECYAKDPSLAPMKAYLPGAVGVLKEHMLRVDKTLVHGVANFDPITGKVNTQTTSDEKSDVVMGSGLYDIVKKVGIRMKYNPEDVLSGRRSMAEILDEAISTTARYSSDEFIANVAVGGMVAMKCVEKAGQDKLIKENIQLQLNIDGENKSISTKGLYAKYQSTFGDLQIIRNKYVDDPNVRVLPQYSIQTQGMSYSLKSGDLIIIPIVKMKYKDGKTKPSLTSFSKGKDGIDRRLVFGFFKGMTGLTNSVDPKSQFMKDLNNYILSSAQDADQAEYLSEMMLILRNANRCIYLEAVK